MMTLIEMINKSQSYLAASGVARPRREAEEVIADVLGIKRLDLYLQFDRLLAEKELDCFRQAIVRRSKHEPTAYISGKVDFAGATISVTPAVLIPRPETEILVEKISQKLSSSSLSLPILWDICCGSGCMGIALKKRFSHLDITMSDLSDQALVLAAQNATNNGVEITLKQGDLFAPFQGLTCDYLVCNPPYISEDEYPLLEPEVRDWEPKMALVSGKTGLEFYARIAEELRIYLKPGGLAWLEIGSAQGEKVQSLFEDQGWRVAYEADWAGHDRFFFIFSDN